MITPVGGFCFLIGWLLVIYEAIKMKSSNWFLFSEKFVIIRGRKPATNQSADRQVSRIYTNYFTALSLK
jgi:hypothetical protein